MSTEERCEATCTGSREEPIRKDWMVKSIALQFGSLEEPDDQLSVVTYTTDGHEIWTYVYHGRAHVAICKADQKEPIAHYHGPAADRAHAESCRLIRQAFQEGWKRSEG